MSAERAGIAPAVTTHEAVDGSVARELLGGVVATGIALACLLPPMVHFLTGPLGPFIGAFVVARRLEPRARGRAIIAVTLGASFAGVGAAVAAAIGGLESGAAPDWFPSRDVLGAILAGMAVYATSLGAAGAVFAERFGAQRSA
jgi:hypothetical protein